MRHFGIIGNPLKQSFSAKFFTEKFAREQIDADYHLFPLDDISQFPQFIREHHFSGLNVTLPFKQSIIPYLDQLDDTAQGVGAVNVINFQDGKLIGYNTDTCGFRESILPLLQPYHKSALILGTGGAAKAVDYALRSLNINTHFVSRSSNFSFTYSELNQDIIRDNLLIVNCTPLGMFPEINACPAIPYQYLTPQHLLYDVIYNPPLTLFLQKGKEQGATTANGLQMLHSQAREAWKIWNNTPSSNHATWREVGDSVVATGSLDN